MLNTIGRIPGFRTYVLYLRLLGMLNTIGRILRRVFILIVYAFARYVKYNR